MCKRYKVDKAMYTYTKFAAIMMLYVILWHMIFPFSIVFFLIYTMTNNIIYAIILSVISVIFAFELNKTKYAPKIFVNKLIDEIIEYANVLNDNFDDTKLKIEYNENELTITDMMSNLKFYIGKYSPMVKIVNLNK